MVGVDQYSRVLDKPGHFQTWSQQVCSVTVEKVFPIYVQQLCPDRLFLSGNGIPFVRHWESSATNRSAGSVKPTPDTPPANTRLVHA